MLYVSHRDICVGWINNLHWSSSHIVVLLVLHVVLLLCFITVHIYLSKSVTRPPRLPKYHSLVSGLLAGICIGASQ